MTNGQTVTFSLTAYAPVAQAYLGLGPAICVSTALGVIDPTSTNNTAVAATEIVPPDLAISMIGTPDLVTVGDTITYTLNVTNLGPVPAFGVAVTNFLPPSLQLASVSVRKGTYTTVPDNNVPGQTDVIATLNEPLLPGQSGLVIITATAMTLGRAADVATVGDVAPDANPGNNPPPAWSPCSRPTCLWECPALPARSSSAKRPSIP